MSENFYSVIMLAKKQVEFPFLRMYIISPCIHTLNGAFNTLVIPSFNVTFIVLLLGNSSSFTTFGNSGKKLVYKWIS
ncbi:hypothetical protein [Sulfuracidifex metallicus]|uniref:hypothetical protein n=1 Tax=Sulfuracidifex metallicus TaxID=47303 RepID=UPI002274828C|nr:hypothetical protein [Sulfuracidifex metallicus]MCY0849852.1 hypothetical protein [Sulfuracidifex metallicus]